jgi:prepilin-type N-terminal cleavage/methylation domain-containing protein
MCASSERRGFTLLEMVITNAILGVVFTAVFTALSDSLTIAARLTADAQLRGEAEQVLDHLVRDLHSTQSGTGAVAIVSTGALSSIAFNPITGTAGTSPSFGSLVTYSFDKTQTAGMTSYFGSVITRSQSGETVGLAGEVTNFSVTAVSPTGLALFPTSTALLLNISIEMTRTKVLPPVSSNADGRVTVTVTADITVPQG